MIVPDFLGLFFKIIFDKWVLKFLYSNLSKNRVEYKSIKDCSYEEFCDWIWISCNYIPFMTLASKDGSDYGDGGFSSLVPIREAIKRGATEVDVVILETEVQVQTKKIGRNPFSLMIDLFQTLLTQVEKHDITIGKLAAKNKNARNDMEVRKEYICFILFRN